MNSKIYIFSDFTLSNYRKLIDVALQNNFRFQSFLDINNKNKSLLWRHDLEFSPEIALEMAKIEHSKNVRSTHFIQLHSEFYNSFEKRTFEIINEIKNLGHYLGLHFDTHFYNITSEVDLNKYIRRDKQTLEQLFECSIDVFSFHNNTPFTNSCENVEYGGVLNIYSKFFKEKVRYCTDSTGIWRYERIENVLKEVNDNSLQVLTHDAMWQHEVMSPRQRVFKVINDRADYLKRFYDKRLKELGAKNVDWDKVL